MRSFFASTAIVSLLGAMAGPAASQTGIEGSAGELSIDRNAEIGPPVPRSTDGPLERFVAPRGIQTQVSTDTEDGNLTVRIALPSGPAIADRFALTASTPLQTGDDAMPPSLDSLANGTKITLSWGHFNLRVGRPREAAGRLQVAETTALAAIARQWCRTANPPVAEPHRCIESSYAVNEYDRVHDLEGAFAASDQALRGQTGGTDYGIDASLGINSFDWVDPVTFGPQSSTEVDWSVAANIAHFFAGSHTALVGSASYQSAHEAAEEELLCPPMAMDPATDCMTARGAAPQRNEHILLSAGLRHRFDRNGELLNLAVAPMVTYDVDDDVWGVDVPVYVFPGSDGELTGGIRFGYRSDRDDEFSVGLFVGTTFDIFN